MRRLVVVGNGMAGMACVEQILKYDPQFRITVFGENSDPLAERIVYRNRRARLKIAVKQDRPSYGPRDEVQLTVRTTSGPFVVLMTTPGTRTARYHASLLLGRM